MPIILAVKIEEALDRDPEASSIRESMAQLTPSPDLDPSLYISMAPT